MRKLAIGVALVWLGGCTFSSSGAPIGDQVGGDDLTSSTGSAGDNAEPEADDNGDGQSSMTSGQPMPPTTMDPATSQGDDDTTGSVDEDGTTEDDGPLTATDEGSTTDDPPQDDPYGDCALGCPQSNSCHVGACGAPCQDASTCAAGLSGNAVPTCGPAQYYPYCLLGCGSGETCPTGMSCQDDFGWYCGW